jgi:uncharacterized protein YdaL
MWILKTPLYKYSIVQRVQACFTSKTDFFSSKHDPSKMASINKQYKNILKNTINKFSYLGSAMLRTTSDDIECGMWNVG